MEENNEYADVYYVDTRNAPSRDHRATSPAFGGFGNRFPMRPVRPAYPMPVQPVQPMQPQVIYAQQPPSMASTLFGKLTTGQVVEMVATLFAAIQPLPAAPVATKDAATDVGNLTIYQGALAQHAKRDEQVRTLGNLIAKLVG